MGRGAVGTMVGLPRHPSGMPSRPPQAPQWAEPPFLATGTPDNLLLIGVRPRTGKLQTLSNIVRLVCIRFLFGSCSSPREKGPWDRYVSGQRSLPGRQDWVRCCSASLRLSAGSLGAQRPRMPVKR